MLEHIVIAERALGKFLPDGTVVHHVNDNRSENVGRNLVICQDQGYHNLLHERRDAYRGIPPRRDVQTGQFTCQPKRQ